MFRELDPDANHIIEMLGNELSYRKIAEQLDCKQRTFFDQMKKNIETEDFTMKKLWNTIQFLLTDINKWLGYFLGDYDGLLYALLVFVIVDYIANVMCAIVNHSLSSEIGFRGICRRVLIFLLVGIANILDVQVLGIDSVLRTAIIFYYISTEGISILENATQLGLPVPKKIKTVFEQLYNRAEDKDVN